LVELTWEIDEMYVLLVNYVLSRKMTEVLSMSFADRRSLLNRLCCLKDLAWILADWGIRLLERVVVPD
jgi:hypothetical protein